MDHVFGTAVLVMAGSFCLLTTWMSASAPRRFAEILGLLVSDTSGDNEIRAQYAGFFCAVACVCGAALVGVIPRQTAFIAVAMVFGGLIAGRLFSLGPDKGGAGYNPTIRALFAIDAVGFGLASAALFLD